LAVDREQFARKVTRRVETHPNIRVIRQEMTKIPDEPCIIASGPLTSPPLAQSLMHLTGSDNLYFICHRTDRRVYLNRYEHCFSCLTFLIGMRTTKVITSTAALNKNEYDLFVHELAVAERIILQDFESEITSGCQGGHHAYFEGCLLLKSWLSGILNRWHLVHCAQLDCAIRVRVNAPMPSCNYARTTWLPTSL